MPLLFLSFFAGILTAFAPCVFPLLPIIVGGGSTEGRNYKRISLIILSLAISIVLFTLLLKASAVLIGLPNDVWKYISGGIIFLLGVVTLFPGIWDYVSTKTGFDAKAGEKLNKSSHIRGSIGPIFMGASLGPVFSSCSPTYAFVVASILPKSFAEGFIYLISYTFGLCLILFLIGILGQRLVSKLKWASNPRGLFKRIIGVLFILVGIGIMFSLDKKVETYFAERGWLDFTQIERNYLR